MNTCEITQNQQGTFDLYINGQFIRSYTRKADAKRGFSRLAKQSTETTEVSDTAESVCDGGSANSRQAVADTQAQNAPASNTGGQTGASREAADKGSNAKKSTLRAHSTKTSQFVMVNGKLKEIPLRQGNETAAHIDTLTFTFTQDVLVEPDLPIDDQNPDNIQQLAVKLSELMQTLMGFGIYQQKNGINGYKYSFVMGTDTAKYGVIAFGGLNQKDSIMIHLYGDGLTAAQDGWENRLYSWLEVFAPFAKITRIDLAHDFINGEFTPDQAKTAWESGGFDNKGQRPRARLHGYDWLDDKRTGKTFYVGTPNSSRMVRVYDKGCEQGDNSSPWVRFELQLRNRDYIIPHDILISAGSYLTAAYPICQDLFSRFREQLKKAERIKKTEMINLEHVLKYASQACSPCINALEQFGFDDEEIKFLLKGGKTKLPKRLGADKHDCRQANVQYIHQMKTIAQQHNAEVQSYMKEISERERQAKFHQRMDKLAEQAKLFRMQQAFDNSWQAAWYEQL